MKKKKRRKNSTSAARWSSCTMSQTDLHLDSRRRAGLCSVENTCSQVFFFSFFFGKRSTLTSLVFIFLPPPTPPPPLLSWLPPRRAAHSLAERGAGRHLLGEDERDLAPPTRLLAAGGNRDVSLTAFARATTPPCLFSYQPAEAQRHKSTRQPGLHGW